MRRGKMRESDGECGKTEQKNGARLIKTQNNL